MVWQIELLLYVLLLVTAVLSLELRNLLAAIVVTSAYSFTCAILFASMGAVDVGFTEAVVGAGIVGVFMVVALYRTSRRGED